MGALISEETMQNALNWGWDSAVDGVPGFGTAEELAEEYLKENKNLEDAIDSLIRAQMIKSGAAGFVTGIGGWSTLAVAIPINLASTVYIQLRMISAIAHMCGQDIRSDRVRTLGFVCLCGKAGKDILMKSGMEFTKGVIKEAGKEGGKEAAKKVGEEAMWFVGSQVGTVAANQEMKLVPDTTRFFVEKAVGAKLTTQFSKTGLKKMLPVIGGLISGGIDVTATRAIGSAAKKMFYNSQYKTVVDLEHSDD